MPKTETPSLDEIAANPAGAAALSAPERQQLALRCAGVITALMSVPWEGPPVASDRLVGLQEAAALLGIAPETLRKKRPHPPFRIQHTQGGSVRYSVAGIQSYIRTRMSRANEQANEQRRSTRSFVAEERHARRSRARTAE
jgi:hypothetical protein